MPTIIRFSSTTPEDAACVGLGILGIMQISHDAHAELHPLTEKPIPSFWERQANEFLRRHLPRTLLTDDILNPDGPFYPPPPIYSIPTPLHPDPQHPAYSFPASRFRHHSTYASPE